MFPRYLFPTNLRIQKPPVYLYRMKMTSQAPSFHFQCHVVWMFEL